MHHHRTHRGCLSAGGRPLVALWEVLLLAVPLLMLAAPAGAEVYKWVDEKGVTHYSSTPPSDRDATVMHLEAPPSKEATEAAVRELEQRLSPSQEQEQAEAAAGEQARQTAAATAEAEQRCRYARKSLAVLQRQAPVYHTDEQGKRVYLDDQQRAAQIQDMQAQVAGYCQ